MQSIKRRNRAKKPAWTYSGLSRQEWQSVPELVKWAQDSTEFRSIITILVNDRTAILDSIPGLGASENRLLGRQEAYEAVRLHLLGLATGATPPTTDPKDNPTYESDDESPMGTVESDFVGID